MVTYEIHFYNGITLLINNPVQRQSIISFTLIVAMIPSHNNTYIYIMG